jgi:hypothetical protein
MTEEQSQSTKSAWIDRNRVCRTVLAVWALLVLATVFHPYFHSVSQHWMEYQEDDFYYYLKVATNFASGAGSTFNGIVPTNGYHPLWMLGLSTVLRVSKSWQAVFGFLSIAILLSTAATFFLAEKLLRASAVPRLIRLMLSAYIATFAMHLYVSGMEVVLALPLMFGLAAMFEREQYWRRGFSQALSLGLLFSAMILSRLDTALLTAMLLTGLLASPTLRRKLDSRQCAGIAIGLLPVGLYLLSNQLWFHTWLPVSGLAKQLKPLSLPTGEAWRSIFERRPLQVLNMVLPLFGFLPLVLLWKRLPAIRRLLYTVLLLFPYAYILLLSMVSDWKLWAWYMYPFWPALCVMFVLYANWQPSVRILRSPSVAALLCTVILTETYLSQRDVGGMEAMHTVGEHVAEFARLHPGTYAMGDRSGIVGYLLPQPMVQTEGLMMDRDFLRRMQQQQPLREALSAYNVRYFIASAYGWNGGCYQASEPYQGGPHSPHMKAFFCEQPIAVFVGDPVTLIYDLHPTETTNTSHE